MYEKVKSVCYGCQCSDAGIIATKKDGELIAIRGDPNCPPSYGRICGKGLSSLMVPYNPQRIMKPLKRMNSKKGLDQEPEFEEISWNEALDIVADKLRWIREEYDPRAHILSCFDYPPVWFGPVWLTASGGQFFFGGSVWCGWYHNVYFNFYQSFYREIDYEHINHLILWGSQSGHLVDALPVPTAREQADARHRGMTLKVIDPVATNVVKSADEWIPIRPGTDGALALGMLNLLLNEFEIYDREFIKHYTNGSYLIASDGRYQRDAETDKPLIWDENKKEAVPFDKAEAPSLEGSYIVNEEKCEPAFKRLKEHVKQWNVERVSKITTIPPETIKRLAREFGEAAKIGSTIDIKGKQFPLRPAAIQQGKGPGPHRHAMHTVYAIEMLNVIMGNLNVPGGQLGISPYYKRRWRPSVSKDGLMLSANDYWKFGCQDPLLDRQKAKKPTMYNCRDLCPIASYADMLVPIIMRNKELFGMTYDIKMTIISHTNIVHSYGNPDQMIKIFDDMNDLIVGFSTEMNETMEYLCDIVIPIAHWTERYDPLAQGAPFKFQTVGDRDWHWLFRRPIKDPPENHKHPADLLLELARRAGFERDVYKTFNEWWQIDEEYQLDPDGQYSYLEMGDALLKDRHGVSVDWFEKRRTNFFTQEKTPEEAYPWCGIFGGRVPIYLEWWLDVGKEVEKVVKEMGIDDIWEVDDYTPLLDWKGCSSHRERKDDELWLVNPRVPTHHQASDINNPWLHEAGEQLPKTFGVLINPETAKDRGIEKGDLVTLESPAGIKEKGIAIITEGIHPDVVGVFGSFGKYAKGEKIAKGSGLHWNKFISFTDIDRLDKVSAGYDSCVLVRVFKSK